MGYVGTFNPGKNFSNSRKNSTKILFLLRISVISSTEDFDPEKTAIPPSLAESSDGIRNCTFLLTKFCHDCINFM